jgi:hypothetical protein
MARRRFTLPVSAALALIVTFCASSLSAGDNQTQKGPAASGPSIVDPSAPKISSQTRLALMRSLQQERVFSRVMFPQGKEGLTLKNGKITPSEQSIAQKVAENGAAARPGDRCVISNVDVRDKEIIFEINGGPKKGPKWYQRIQIVGNTGASNVPGTPSPQSLDAHGSVVKLEFDKYVPEMTGDQLRAMLDPIFDFKALTQVEAYEKTLPPKLQEAIKNHQILVGMDKDMVIYSKGRPPQKVRDKDEQGHDYEEWIYGTPPEEVDFVRFKGNEVARLEIMTVDGQKIVRTEKEIDLKSQKSELAEKKAAPKPEGPSLMRPGEQPEMPPPQDSDHRVTRTEDKQAPTHDGNPYPDSTGTPGTGPGAGGQIPPQQPQ